MLANPHWNAPSLSSAEAWLETKDPTETYRYTDSKCCGCAQYLQAVGKFDQGWLTNAKLGDVMHQLNALAAGETIGGESDHTFGGFLARVRHARKFEMV